MKDDTEGKRNKRPLIYAAASAVAVLLVASLLGVFKAPSAKDLMRILCDAFFVVGVLLGGVGLLSWVGSNGFFDIFSYAVKVVVIKFRPKARLESYYDYKQSKDEERKPWLKGLLLCGGICIILSIVALVIYNRI